MEDGTSVLPRLAGKRIEYAAQDRARRREVLKSIASLKIPAVAGKSRTASYPHPDARAETVVAGAFLARG